LTYFTDLWFIALRAKFNTKKRNDCIMLKNKTDAHITLGLSDDEGASASIYILAKSANSAAHYGLLEGSRSAYFDGRRENLQNFVAGYVENRLAATTAEELVKAATTVSVENTALQNAETQKQAQAALAETHTYASGADMFDQRFLKTMTGIMNTSSTHRIRLQDMTENLDGKTKQTFLDMMMGHVLTQKPASPEVSLQLANTLFKAGAGATESLMPYMARLQDQVKAATLSGNFDAVRARHTVPTPERTETAQMDQPRLQQATVVHYGYRPT
jgi:hypothetical protein